MRRFVLLALFGAADVAQAQTVQVLIGPPSIGLGGSNPVSIPPVNPVDWQISYVTADQQEWVVSLIPGLLWGQRFRYKQFYAALGGGLLVTPTGYGVGGVHALGYQSEVFWRRMHFDLEYRQVIGIATYGLQFPYTLRLGVSYVL